MSEVLELGLEDRQPCELYDSFVSEEPSAVPSLATMRSLKASLSRVKEPLEEQKLVNHEYLRLATASALVSRPQVSVSGRTDLWYAQEAILETQIRRVQLSSRPVRGVSWSA